VAADEGFDDDGPEFTPPLPPEDRLWRHPAEVGASAAFAPSPAPARQSGRSPWTVGFVSVIGGVLLASSLMFGAGGVGDDPGRIALQPIATLEPRGATDDGDGADPVALDSVPPPAALVGINADTGAEQRSGNGVVVSTDGVVVTPASLVAGALEIRVTDDRGAAHPAAMLGVDPLNDLAVLRVAGLPQAPAVIDPSAKAITGETVRAFGASRGVAHPSWTATVANDEARVAVGATDIHGVLQLDHALDATAAGAAVVRSDGAVVGIITTVQPSGATHVIPTRTITSITAQIVAWGQARHGWLGIEGVTSSAVGAQVRRVLDGSPAQQAGFVADDVIVTIDGEGIETIGDLVVAVREKVPGTTVAVGVDRGGTHVDLAVVVGEVPPTDLG
jgi:S1-C subfamily serine protease